ncbi:hypothetical protein SMSP2_00695 [Limihaloglobus sulfuriphilus]|uniref:Signal peptidase I n=1 Tax=Limihaloglobus sulfuriphilus TaxID=1851148 RepID=A0A1Q2MCE7_9BACT|nr:DUF5684 domain-containing protein [Limihaloglobus sulfuriphilus]AQQ70350.1 hypothetical protein SMSP2_00695 [Limihaloglobus sulfuriphilus]
MQDHVLPPFAIIPFVVLGIFLAVLYVIAWWKIFQKAGKPGWASIIPFYNAWVTCQIAGMSGWAFIGFFIPYINLVFGIIVTVLLAKNFGRGVGFMLGLIFLPFIFYLILGFGESKYIGPI